jgi:catechol 2,3-dioxygenase-like lactoylglutathione lyase family enzyme
MTPVHELRVAVTVDDYEDARHFYRDVLGLPVVQARNDEEGRSGAILDAGRATLELLSCAQTDLVDEIGAATPRRSGSRSRSTTRPRPPTASRPGARSDSAGPS